MSNRDYDYDRDREGDYGYSRERFGEGPRTRDWGGSRFQNMPWLRQGYFPGEGRGGYRGHGADFGNEDYDRDFGYRGYPERYAGWGYGGYGRGFYGEPYRSRGTGYSSGYGEGFERGGGNYGRDYEEGYGEGYYGSRPWYQESRGWQGQGWRGGQGFGEPGQWQGQGWRTRGRFSGMAPENYHRSDDRIREDINDRLTEHPEIDPSHVNVQVNSGEVILTGDVDDRWMKRMAEDVADSVPGVRDVRNELKTGHAEHRNQGQRQHMQAA